GMIPLDLRKIGAAYYTGNCHKWVCAPKGVGFLHVRRDRQAQIVPLIVSHGYNRPRSGYSRYQDLFDWGGTSDPTAYLCVPAAIDFLQSLLPGGMKSLCERNHRCALAARQLLIDECGTVPLVPDDMLGTMAAVSLGDDPNPPDEPI